MPQSTRQLAAIMFTDMVGYTALMQENEQLALQRRDSNQKIFENALAKFDGKLLQYYGDGTLSIFTSAVNAIRCSIEIQTLSRQDKIDLRIGIHIGDVMTDDKGIYGDSVNVASRIESLAVPGSIFISEKIYDDVKNHEGISAKAMGYFELKNVNQPMQVYAITNTGLVVPSRDDLRGKTKTVLNGIAVLPFASLSSDPENEFFCDGITEELINVLSKVDGLQVTSRTSAFAFKGKNEDVREIAAKLNVQKVLEGSVRKAGNKVRITAQLINAADGYHIWSETYERTLEDIFEVQDEISRGIANKMRENLSSSDHEKTLVKAPTENLDAYKKYLQGIHYWNKQNLHDMWTALALFEEAVKMEPSFANPYCNIALITWFLGYAGMMEAEESTRRCREAAVNAMRYDPSNPNSWLALGFAEGNDWNWSATYNALQKAIKLNPSTAMAHMMMAWHHIIMLEGNQAVESAKTAVRCDPMGGETNGSLAEMYLMTGKFEEAIAVANETLAIDPFNMYAMNMKGLAIGFGGDWKQSLEIFEELAPRAGPYPIALLSLGLAYANNGMKEKTLDIIYQLKKIQEQRPGISVAYEVSLLYLHLGDMEQFYKYYEQSIALKSIGSLYRYGTSIMKNIRNDKRLISIREKLGLPV